MLVNNSHSPLKPSTAAAGIGTANVYTIFIRIDDELMKIINVSSAKAEPRMLEHSGTNFSLQTLTVGRGFDFTSSTAHSANSSVLAPVYESAHSPGKLRRVPSDGILDYRVELTRASGSSTRPRRETGVYTYVLNPQGVYASNVLVNLTVTAVRNGYAGAWFNGFVDGVVSAVDMGGRPLLEFPYWNTETGAKFTEVEFDEAQRHRLMRVWDGAYSDLGFYPTVLASDVANFYFPYGR